MKNFMRIMLVAAVTFIAVGCAEQPTKEMDAAKASIDAVVAEGGEVYAINETRELTESYDAAMSEVKVQDDKFFKDYKKSIAMLTKVTEEAVALEQVIPARKETAKKNAELALSTVETKITETVALLATAPRGKGSALDLAAMRQDLNGLEESLSGIKKMIQEEDYLSVPDKVAPVLMQVTEIAKEVNTAIEKQMKFASAKKKNVVKKK